MAQTSKTAVRRIVTTVFTFFFLCNVILAVLALGATFGGGRPMSVLPEDTGPAIRVFIVLAGTALAWLLARWLYLQMLHGDFGPDESASGAAALMVYLVLLFSGAVFAGPVLWAWLLLLLLVMILIALFGLRSTVGTLLAAIVITVCLATGVILYYFLPSLQS
ncbi:MAG: hypothetical protein ABSH50_32075 [Bryobacteraceae bacterium]|jgi:hypothetical protein